MISILNNHHSCSYNLKKKKKKKKNTQSHPNYLENATSIPYRWISHSWSCWKSIQISCLNFETLFFLELATNPIDFFYVMWLTLKWWIRGLFIEYKSNIYSNSWYSMTYSPSRRRKTLSFYDLLCCQLLSCDYARSHLNLHSSLS
jgi:hypothetical protein